LITLGEGRFNANDRIEVLEPRLKFIVDASKVLGVPACVRAVDLTLGNSKINLLFTTLIFHTKPGLVPSEKEIYDAAQLVTDDLGDSREERGKIFSKYRYPILSLSQVFRLNIYLCIKGKCSS
jgi:hypothetical protein